MDEKKKKQVLIAVAGVAGLSAIALIAMNFLGGAPQPLSPEVDKAATAAVAEMNQKQEEAAKAQPVEQEIDTTKPDAESDVIYGRIRKVK